MKQIIKSKADDEKKLNHPNRIMNEINIMKKLDHPFIVSVYNIVETPEAVFLVLELMNGGDLYNKIKESKYLKEPIVKNIIYQLAVAVNYLHRQNITHRDLKPENIPLQSNSDDSIVKLSDFGLSKIVEGNTVLKTECGTAWYVASDVILKSYKTYTEKVDVWSLGVILFVCLCGCLPFSAADQICKGKYFFKQCVWSSVSAECKNLISKMLQVDPKTSYSSFEVLNHKWLQDPDVIKRYNDLLNQENEKQEITVSDFPPAKRHRQVYFFLANQKFGLLSVL
ncbi:ovarian-specific serine/threonine-protein kinase Lok-like [Ctenocephalides felis]|uniref:ovarian-specific serine/threonine-protein kinase Lok-like n=1 Tax=Ctenocephalides felis TaxID=7515 RepID=UPI000E6E4379|nr:ovarian-specific serine/threonine-protein kinase Lok-like [Ctenocephalides felis]